jgi:hypothetical protein
MMEYWVLAYGSERKMVKCYNGKIPLDTEVENDLR